MPSSVPGSEEPPTEQAPANSHSGTSTVDSEDLHTRCCTGICPDRAIAAQSDGHGTVMLQPPDNPGS